MQGISKVNLNSNFWNHGKESHLKGKRADISHGHSGSFIVVLLITLTIWAQFSASSC